MQPQQLIQPACKFGGDGGIGATTPVDRFGGVVRTVGPAYAAAMDATGLSTFEQLRRRRHQRWLDQLQLRLAETLGDLPCRVWLFGSRARGDWDGFSDTDLLVEADSAELAEQGAEQLRRGLVGDDVLAVDATRWQAMADDPSPHWRSVRAQARMVHPSP